MLQLPHLTEILRYFSQQVLTEIKFDDLCESDEVFLQGK